MLSEDPKNKKPISGWSIPGRPSSKRSWLIIIACICTLLFHFLFIVLSHFGLINFSIQTLPLQKKQAITYEIALNNPDTMRFVDTNPYLNPEEPIATNNYAAKSQHAAQEIPAETRQKDMPTIDGDLEDILKIVPDRLAPHDELLEIVDLPTPSPSLIDLPEEFKQQEILEGPKIPVRPQPKPRQRVKPLVGGVRNNTSASQNIGVTAVDAKFNQFGVYRQKMNEAIGYQWYMLVSNYGPSMHDLRGKVRISYTIDQTGSIINLEVKESSDSNLLTLICKDSILSLVSFGPWNDDMKKVLGKEQTFTVGFTIR